MTFLRVLVAALLATSVPLSLHAQAPLQPPLRVAVVGLAHDHVIGLFRSLTAHPEMQLVGVSDPSPELRKKYAAANKLPDNLMFATEESMLAATHPQVILVYTSIAGHRAAIEAAAPLHIAAMVEKPLATTVEDALAIQALAAKYDVPVLTNYETTWYANNTAAHQIVEDGSIGDLRKMVVHDGHRGPKEIGVSPEFLDWLTDPKQNGAGAMFDFGCYGVDLATWFMHEQLPLTVSAVMLHDKPEIYPKVDDDSTIVLTYPHAQVIVQGSWNWPFDRKDIEVYGAKGYVDTVYLDSAHGDQMRIRLPGEKTEHLQTAPALASPQDNSLDYLYAVMRGDLKAQHDLTSLDTNVQVVRVLDAARRAAMSGRTIHLADEVGQSK